MPATKSVQWKACSRGHVFLGTRGCPACERAQALRPKGQTHPRRQASDAATQELSGRAGFRGLEGRQRRAVERGVFDRARLAARFGEGLDVDG